MDINFVITKALMSLVHEVHVGSIFRKCHGVKGAM